MYQSCISGRLVCVPDPDIDYTATQTVKVSIEQNNQILVHELINCIDTSGQLFTLEFTYLDLINPLKLIVDNTSNKEQFNKDNPVELTTILLDDLFTLPHLLYSGQFYKDTQLIDTGNVLCQSGKLVYTIKLPMVTQANIVSA